MQRTDLDQEGINDVVEHKVLTHDLLLNVLDEELHVLDRCVAQHIAHTAARTQAHLLEAHTARLHA